MSEPLDSVLETALSNASDPEDLLAREQAKHAAISRFVELVPAQRSAVILKDVLGHSLAELAQLMAISEVAAKATLHRGRERLRALAEAPPLLQPTTSPGVSPGVARYVALFNAPRLGRRSRPLGRRRAPRLGVPRPTQRRREVSSYVANYATVADWHLAPGSVDGRKSSPSSAIVRTLAPPTSSNYASWASR